MTFEPLHTRPSAPYPSGRRYQVWKLRGNGQQCRAPGCGGDILSPRREAAYCSDPVCQAVRARKQNQKRRDGQKRWGSTCA